MPSKLRTFVESCAKEVVSISPIDSRNKYNLQCRSNLKEKVKQRYVFLMAEVLIYIIRSLNKILIDIYFEIYVMHKNKSL